MPKKPKLVTNVFKYVIIIILESKINHFLAFFWIILNKQKKLFIHDLFGEN